MIKLSTLWYDSKNNKSNCEITYQQRKQKLTESKYAEMKDKNTKEYIA